MPAPMVKGNKLAVKLTTEELKKKAYESYCAHIASGKSKEGWFFKSDDGHLLCVYKTIEKYIKADPSVFPSIQKEIAEAQSFSTWEKRGSDMMDGVGKCEPALYQMFMRNKFGWDKKEKDQAPTDQTMLSVLKDWAKSHISLSPEAVEESNKSHSD